MEKQALTSAPWAFPKSALCWQKHLQTMPRDKYADKACGI